MIVVVVVVDMSDTKPCVLCGARAVVDCACNNVIHPYLRLCFGCEFKKTPIANSMDYVANVLAQRRSTMPNSVVVVAKRSPSYALLIRHDDIVF